ncbi:hypothetical protein GCM10010336_63150 [Streptomyces goshikiensis]|nr:hypothetical protein GCM10010336_63150 [Streptomyces goshikiensis]
MHDAHKGEAPPPYRHVGAWHFEQGPVWLGAQEAACGLAGVSGVVIVCSWAVRKTSLLLDLMFDCLGESVQVTVW